MNSGLKSLDQVSTEMKDLGLKEAFVCLMQTGDLSKACEKAIEIRMKEERQ